MDIYSDDEFENTFDEFENTFDDLNEDEDVVISDPQGQTKSEDVPSTTNAPLYVGASLTLGMSMLLIRLQCVTN
jgi:hypothetical protein